MRLSFATPLTSVLKGRKTKKRSGPETEQGGRSWRRKAMLAGATIGLTALIRRLRSRSGSDRSARSDDPSSTTTTGDSAATGGSGWISRKASAVVVFVVTTLALRMLRKHLLSGSDPGR